MARKLKANGADASESAVNDPKHNVKELDQIIRECRDGMLSIRAQRKELNEDAGEIRQRLKDAVIDTRAFDLNVRIYEMEQDVRANYMDAMRLCYEAMNKGDQLDWIDATSDAPADAPAPSDERLAELRENGRTAGKMGRDASTNPHGVETHEGAAWHDGWLKGQKAEAAKAFGAPEPQDAA